ncbi:MAG: autotransporter adhesin family protein [Treponema sp.]|jgi:hypothetical protein|nr:autotransporter adhesin family protein [Treponema sp.]
MKKIGGIFFPAFSACIVTGLLFMAGCSAMFLEDPAAFPVVSPSSAVSGGILKVSLAGVNVGASRTMLPLNPVFTRYELEYSGPGTGAVSFYNSAFQVTLPAGTYNLTVWGYEGDTRVSKSETKTSITILSGGFVGESFTLKPYMNGGANPENGTLSYSLSWDGLSRMPWRAELLIETFADAGGTLADPPRPITHDLIPPELVQGSDPGTILLLQQDTALVNLAGSLALPPGEYRVTMTVTMDKGGVTTPRTDIAHIYSNLTTSAPFFYGGGDLYISNTSPDSGASFITGFTFTETPNATTVIGSEPGVDGTRMIMIMVPPVPTPDTFLAALTPIVTCAEGSFITSPVPATQPTQASPNPGYGPMDFTGPMIWTAQAKNGAVQKYTVVVSAKPVNLDKSITYLFFRDYAGFPGIIDQDAATINVTLPFTAVTSITPVVSIIGQKAASFDGSSSPGTNDTPISGTTFTLPSAGGVTITEHLRVYATDSGDNSPKVYTLTVTRAANTEAEITRFAIDGYPNRAAPNTDSTIGSIGGIPVDGYYPIALRLPYGVSLKNLTPLVQYKGKKLEPASGVQRNFGAPALYTVTADDGTTAKTYKVTITNDPPDQNTGIFDFRVTNVPAAKVVIGQKPRQDGKIPIVIQVPNGTDEYNMIAAITLSSSNSTISPGNGKINFGSDISNHQEAVYTVTAQDGITTQQYVVVVSEGPEYYYVDGDNGDDDWPDYYNGGSESHPFKTLAYAVKKAAELIPPISKIFIKGDLTAANQTGDGADSSLIGPDSVVTINGTGSAKITITSVNGSTLQGVSGKRVLEIKGGADLVFENINITGGNTTGDGGGIHISGNSKVKFSGGNITGNTARNGGGVYIEDATGVSPGSEFDFMSGTISGNTATGAVADNGSNWEANPTTSPIMGGGGGVYVNGKALFWLASGTISNNTTKGAGGGVLVNGSDHDNIEEGFLMSGGTISGNTTTSQTYPHGGGGVYVAHGAFEMLNGSVTGNTATRQGGGVFVHWGDARFTASGNSSITGNDGVGSSKAICNRGTAEMTDNARADKVYIWDYDEDNYIDATDPAQSFTLAKGAQVAGLVLAYSAHDKNYVTITGITNVDPDLWDGPVCTIDLESRLIGGLLHAPLSDWYGHTVISGASDVLKNLISGSSPAGSVNSNADTRLPLNTFTGSPSLSNLENTHKIVINNSEIVGKLYPR